MQLNWPLCRLCLCKGKKELYQLPIGPAGFLYEYYITSAQSQSYPLHHTPWISQRRLYQLLSYFQHFVEYTADEFQWDDVTAFLIAYKGFPIQAHPWETPFLPVPCLLLVLCQTQFLCGEIGTQCVFAGLLKIRMMKLFTGEKLPLVTIWYCRKVLCSWDGMIILCLCSWLWSGMHCLAGNYHSTHPCAPITTSKGLKPKEHAVCLERHLRSWREGDLETLLIEGRTIQHRLPKTQKTKPEANFACTFAQSQIYEHGGMISPQLVQAMAIVQTLLQPG